MCLRSPTKNRSTPRVVVVNPRGVMLIYQKQVVVTELIIVPEKIKVPLSIKSIGFLPTSNF